MSDAVAAADGGCGGDGGGLEGCGDLDKAVDSVMSIFLGVGHEFLITRIWTSIE